MHIVSILFIFLFHPLPNFCGNSPALYTFNIIRGTTATSSDNLSRTRYTSFKALHRPSSSIHHGSYCGLNSSTGSTKCTKSIPHHATHKTTWTDRRRPLESTALPLVSSSSTHSFAGCGQRSIRNNPRVRLCFRLAMKAGDKTGASVNLSKGGDPFADLRRRGDRSQMRRRCGLAVVLHKVVDGKCRFRAA